MDTMWARRVGSIFVVSICALACGSGPPSERRLKRLVEQASETSTRDLATLVQTDEWSSIRDQDLTLAFAFTAPHEVPCNELPSMPETAEAPALEIFTPPWDRGELLKCLVENPDEGEYFNRLWQGLEHHQDGLTGSASLLRKENIKGIEYQATEDTIKGEISFEKKNCFRGRLSFEAIRMDRNWVISSFTLPGGGWRVDLGEDDRWRISPVARRSLLPDLESLSAEQISDIQIVDTAPSVVKHNGVVIEGSELSKIAAGKFVILRPQPEARFGDVLSSLAGLVSVEPSVAGVLWVTRRMVPGCWCMTSIEQPTNPLHRHEPGWTTTLKKVERTAFPRNALQLCVGQDGFRYSNGKSLPVPLPSARDVIAFAVDDVRARPDAVFVLTIDPETPYELVDKALDAVWATHARRLFLYTDRHSGYQFEGKNQ